MGSDLIHDRGRGPEIVGTRITVYNLLPYFLDETATEAFLCRPYKLTPAVAYAARADGPEILRASIFRRTARTAARTAARPRMQ